MGFDPAKYLLEGMGCPGGCVAGAGTLQPTAKSSAAIAKYKKDAELQNPFATTIPISSSKVSTKSTSLRMVRRLASSFLAEQGIASAQGLQECKKMLMLAKAGKYNGYLLEGMGCPGGCVAGAGTLQPTRAHQLQPPITGKSFLRISYSSPGIRS